MKLPFGRNSKLTVLALALAVAVSACGQQQEPTADSTAPVTTTEAAPEAVEKATPDLATFSPFAGILPEETSNKECALDTLNGQPPAATSLFEAGSSAALGGWTGNGAGQQAQGFYLVLKGATQSYSTPVQTGIERSDVASSLNAPALANSGYVLNISLKDVAAGDYAMYLADPANPEASACNLNYSFKLQ